MLSLPIIVAPMFLVSTPALAMAAMRNGVIGSIPAHNARKPGQLDNWLSHIQSSRKETDGLLAVNVVLRRGNHRLDEQLDLCEKHNIQVMLTSEGYQPDVFKRIHDWGGKVYHDVSSARHAEKADEADGYIAVTQQAGGYCGTTGPFALMNELREVTDKPIILAGGIMTGRDIRAAEMLGATYVYMGTRFIAAEETMCDYKDLVVESSAKDIFYSAEIDGIPGNWIQSRITDDVNRVDDRYARIPVAGQGIGSVKSIESTTDIINQLKEEYHVL
jgi:nitronate monooxygenase